MSERPQQLRAVVHGRVQGVSFRYYTLQRANALGLTGWVRNNPDRTVELVAEGPRPALDQLIGFLWEGPPAARVTDVDLSWFTATGRYPHFEITG